MRTSVPGQGSLFEACSQLHELENRPDGKRGQQRNRCVPEKGGVRRVKVPRPTTVPGDEGVLKGEVCHFRHLGEQSAVCCVRRKIFHRDAEVLDDRLDDSVA